MATLNENVNIIKDVFSDIKAALQKKGVTVAGKTPVEEYPSMIEGITGGIDVPADIYNHGDLPDFAFSPYYHINQVLSGSSSAAEQWRIDYSNYLYSISYKGTMHSNITFGTPIYRGKYTKLCFDCEVPRAETNAGTYADAYLGIRYCENGPATNRTDIPDVFARLIDYSSESNYDNTEPWYNLKRQVVEFDLTQLEDKPFFLMFKACDCYVNIYSIWLE